MVQPKRLKSGRYLAREYLGDGKYATLGTYDTLKEALKVQLLAEAGIRPDQPEEDTTRGAVTFERFAEDILWSRRHTMARTTMENYQSKLRVHIVPTFGKKRLRDITPTMVTRWWNQLPETATRRQIYVVLNMVMRRAVKLGEIEKNPCQVEGVAKIKSPKKEVQHWADLRFLVDMAGDTQMRALLWTLAGTGMRVGEALALDWEDIDFTEGTVLVDQHLTKFGMEDGFKSHSDKERTAVAFPEALDALQALQNERGVRSGPVFLHSRGGRMSYVTAWGLFDALKKSIGLEIGFHHLRALHASTFVKHATIEQTMAQLGHDDLRSTLRYVASDADSRKAVVKALHGTY